MVFNGIREEIQKTRRNKNNIFKKKNQANPGKNRKNKFFFYFERKEKKQCRKNATQKKLSIKLNVI